MIIDNIKMQRLKKRYDTKGYMVVRNIFDRSDIIEAGEDLENSFLLSLNALKGRDINKTKNNIINSVHLR